jgi:membrane-associated phospholipid phosphatase
MIHLYNSRRKSWYFIFLFSIACNFLIVGQDSLKTKVYKVNPYIEIPVTAVLTVTNFWGLNVVDSKPDLDSITIISLDANNINRFDRSATRQNVDFAPTARMLSDYGLYISYAIPFFLAIDKEIRKDWAPLLLLYLETQAIAGNLFSWGAAIHIDRIRPLVYNPDVPWEDRTGKRTQNSFYSGHTSTSASASFFTAKVYCDYHPELGNKKFIVYSLALIPPLYTGLFRYKGMKHFPTDVLTGMAVGAATGILIPHLHKKIRSELAIVPFAGQVNGLALSYNF